MLHGPQLGTSVLRMATTTDRSRSIAARVATSLQEAGINQRDAAAATGIAINTLSRRLTGFSPFTIPELEAVANLLGTTVVALVSEDAA